MRRVFLLILICQAVTEVCLAQKDVEEREQLWIGYFNQSRFTKRSGIWLDLHHRRTGDFVDRPSLNLARIAYIYYLSDQTKLMAGYANVRLFSTTTDPVTEHRPWQQIQWHDKKNGFALMQWFRVEERYRQTVVSGEVTNNYSFNWRLRYNFALTLPLKGKQIVAKTPFLFFNNEIHINAGKQILNNYFDQNRFFVGLGYQFTSHLNAHLGYMNVFQQLPAANKFVNIDAIRLFVFHNIDFRSKEN